MSGRKGSRVELCHILYRSGYNRGMPFRRYSEFLFLTVDRLSVEGKGKLTKWNQDVRTATADCPTFASLFLIWPSRHVTQNTASLMEAVTGLDFTPEEVAQVGERVNNLARPLT